jgi:uncharacterized RDD family membrane protein YckC
VPAPEKLTIDTPEQIALEYPLASAGSRFLALGLDTLLQAAGFVLLALAALVAVDLGAMFAATLATWSFAVLLLVAFLIYYGYFAFFEALWNGQTPGKRVVGIRVITASGRPLAPMDAILRNLLRIVDQLPGIYAVGVLSIFFTARNQRLGDLAAGTVVVHERAIELPVTPEWQAGSRRHRAARLSAEEIALVETFLHRRHALDPYLRLTTARKIVERVGRRLELPAGSAIDEERLLEELVAEYRSR